jgi:E3 ubiquitin-protein ligase SspH2
MTIKAALKRIRCWKKKKNPRKWLNLSYLNLTELPPLPSNVRRLNCSGNMITDFTNTKIPKGIKKLRCWRNELQTLKGLPNSLLSIECHYNYDLVSIDDIPDSVEYIDTTGCYSIETIDKLPRNLKVFIFWKTKKLKQISMFPHKLEYISIGETRLDKLPDLPKSLKSLTLCFSKVTKIPILYEGLEDLYLFSNYINYLPPLPNSLINLDISGNYDLELPITLPPNIEFYRCNDLNLCINDDDENWC